MYHIPSAFARFNAIPTKPTVTSTSVVSPSPDRTLNIPGLPYNSAPFNGRPRSTWLLTRPESILTLPSASIVLHYCRLFVLDFHLITQIHSPSNLPPLSRPHPLIPAVTEIPLLPSQIPTTALRTIHLQPSWQRRSQAAGLDQAREKTDGIHAQRAELAAHAGRAPGGDEA